ncbi:hypothetical protein GUITHDRAFT_114659 [Guillardia theta CCMP2712]|uniref:CS domain-containing protein n=1 Tax=Guillardia theta (strain CCMP2712) TaxID=905079 RepID=L1ITL4_GUITC|nr:hypothetical protein GUITHDRAFT_114659 [Guillardia theta CCMP2712]EKX39224.1 hypothetical protein GUITHDRAFT_114659 [Guillardia theta CCMP2712]|eukprot:XP_005826204.1 hypothetical protein GUITHDRAFT_114659 [Guillardia theta CCMP2712]
MPLKLRGPAGAGKRISLCRKGGSFALKAVESGMEEKDISTNEVQFIDSSERCLVVLPIEEDVKSRNIECEITKNIIFLSVNGNRILDGEMWSSVKLDDSYWEIDEYGGYDRCIVIRLVKSQPGAWPLLLKQDYDPNAADWADRQVVSRKEVSKEDVEKALQLLVALMKPSLLELPAVAEKEEEREGTENEELDEPKVAWKNAVDETIEEEWEDAARSYREALSNGGTPENIMEMLKSTQMMLTGMMIMLWGDEDKWEMETENEEDWEK